MRNFLATIFISFLFIANANATEISVNPEEVIIENPSPELIVSPANDLLVHPDNDVIVNPAIKTLSLDSKIDQLKPMMDEVINEVQPRFLPIDENLESDISRTINDMSNPEVLEAIEHDLEVLSASDTYDLDGKLDNFIKPISDKIVSVIFYTYNFQGQEVPLILLWLVIASIFFTLYFKFTNIRMFAHAINLVRGKGDFSTDEESHGQINRFQAMSTSLSATVGLGNIAGVAIAISVGGPGAMVWMILMGFFGMSAKFVECTLGVKYRHELPDGRMSGGPMYYIRDGFSKRGPVMTKIGALMAGFFAICCIGGALGGGNMFQANQAYQQVINVTGGADASYFVDKGWLFGLILAVIVGFVIIGGIKSIASVASKIVPLMAFIYVAACLVVIFGSFSEIPAAFGIIIESAFSGSAAAGGFLGALIQGVRRAAFSNEAGIGSSPIAHAAIKTDSPVSEGLVSMLEPMIDTIIICTMTALVIVISGVYLDGEGMEGVTLTSRAFEDTISWFPTVLSVAVILFAFSTMIAWSYYGLKAFTYLFGESKLSELTFKIIFCLAIILGSAANLSSVLNLSDAMIFAMAVPNIIALYVLSSEVKMDLILYKHAVKTKA